MRQRLWMTIGASVLTTVIGLSLPTTARAEDPAGGKPERHGREEGPGGPDHRPMPGERLERMRGAIEHLDLTADQKEKVKTIFDDAREKFKALRTEAENGGDKEALRDKAKAIFEGVRDGVEKVLTPEQLEKLKAMREKHGGPGGPGGPGGKHGDGPHGDKAGEKETGKN